MCVKQDKAASFCSLCERHSHGECVGFSAPCPYILSYFLKGEFEWQDKVKEKKMAVNADTSQRYWEILKILNFH